MGAYLTGSLIRPPPVGAAHQPEEDLGGIFRRARVFAARELGLFKLMPGHLSVLNLTHAIVLGLLLGFAAVIGDLAESIVKRSTGVKDSGNILPGIGGALDLIDSLLLYRAVALFLSAACHPRAVKCLAALGRRKHRLFLV